MKNKKLLKSTKEAYFALTLATLALIINFWAWTLLSPLGVKYAAELSLDPAKLSLLLAVPVIIGSLGRIVLGMLTDRFGGRIMFSVVCLLTSLPVIGLTLVNDFSQLLLVAAFLGLGGAIFAVGIPFISPWFSPAKRGLILGIYSAGNIGTALSAFATPRLEGLIGRDPTFLLVSGLLITIGTVFAIYGRNSPEWKPDKGSSTAKLIEAVRQPLTWDLAIVYAVSFGAFVAFRVYLPVLLKVAYGLTLTDAASRAAGFVLLATIARPIGGFLSDKIGGKYIVQLCLLMIIFLASFVAFQPTLSHQTTVAYLLLAFILGCCNGAVFALVGRRAKPTSMGSVTGIIGAVGGLGGFLPPLVLGLTFQKTGSYAIALMMLAIISFVVLLRVRVRFKDVSLYKSIRQSV